ncbi:MAG: helix-turn-helix transcriptional regulator [Sterolibacterium sp.]
MTKHPKQPIADFRKKAGLTLDAAAAIFDVDRTTLIRWEKGEPLIPIKRLDDAAKIYGVSKRELRPDLAEAME